MVVAGPEDRNALEPRPRPGETSCAENQAGHSASGPTSLYDYYEILNRFGKIINCHNNNNNKVSTNTG